MQATPQSSEAAPTTTTAGRDFSLENILGENPHDIQHLNGTSATGWDEESTEGPLAEGYCIECGGERARRFQS